MPDIGGGSGKAANASAGRPTLQLAELEWEVKGYTFWNNKREFTLQSDTYPAWCLFAVENGSFAYEIGDNRGVAGGGSLVLCPPGVPFRRRIVSASLTFHFVLLRRNEPYPAYAPEAGDEDAFPVCFTPGDRLRLFDTYDKWKTIGALTGYKQLSLFAHYWNDIWKTWCLEHAGGGDSADPARSSDRLMNRAARRLEERFSEPYGVKELAGELGLSPVQLIRRFRAAYGVTPGDYLTGLRLEKACRLLRETRMTVEQVASACGYATGYYLSRLFAARIGAAPSEYRKRHRV
ncbi:AraC family transcriptional regulator [Paenibacillus sp. GYB003]|uniref:AraC family transcriptional regulator n=1 Tax=Paenibacillus sp. GYB003 TaxID=2994392 RepID=UPI002F9673BA